MKKGFMISFCFILFLVLMILFLKFYVKNDKLYMENFIGKNIAEVQKFALEYNLTLNIIQKNTTVYDQGIVLEQTIPEGVVFDRGDVLNITVSTGTVDIPLYQEVGVNELGKIPVMMYHGIVDKSNSDTPYIGGNVDVDGYQRTIESFRNDLEFYYRKGYRMIRLKDYIDGKIDVPFGMSPIVLTFDDGLDNNILVTGLDENGELMIHPNSAVGVLEEFKRKYPDFQVTATFFINSGLFHQPEYNEQILTWLLNHGYDIGNHTKNHKNLQKISSDEVQIEVGYMYHRLEEILGNRYVHIVALPFGTPYSKEHANAPFILNGTYDSHTYYTESTMRVAWESNESPFDIDFDRTFIKRIRAYDNQGMNFDIEMNFKILDIHRYVSDGDVNTIAYPKDTHKSVGNSYDLKIVEY